MEQSKEIFYPLATSSWDQLEIDAIQKEIANGERDLKSAKKNPLQSKKLEQLREQKKSLEALRDKYLPKTSDPFEQQRAEKAARTNLTKEIIELNTQIQKGQKDVLTETKSPESEGIEKLMQEKKARQAILEALDPTPKMFVEQALIEKGFGKKIKVKTLEDYNFMGKFLFEKSEITYTYVYYILNILQNAGLHTHCVSLLVFID